jgi:hypothetical protein
MKRTVNVIMAVLLAVVLTACGVAGSPKQSVIEQAIAQQINLIQQDIGQQLYFDQPSLPAIAIDRLKITRRQPLMINQQHAYRIQGLYDATLTFPQQQVHQQQTSFEVFLQQQPEEKTWQLARPTSDGESQTWSLIPLG